MRGCRNGSTNAFTTRQRAGLFQAELTNCAGISAMNKPNKQHYVPQFMLREFASLSKKIHKTWTLDKKTQNIWLASVREVAHENQFYEHTDPNGDHIELESLFANIDFVGADVCKKILESKTLRLPSKDLVWLSYIVASQMIRTLAAQKNIENIRKLIIHKWGPDVSAEGDNRTIGEYGPKDDKECFLKSMQDVPEYAKILQEKVWLLEESPSDYPFIIGDNPVTRYNMIDHWPHGSLGLKKRGIELYMPLSPRYSIHIICPVIAEATLRFPELLPSKQVNAMKNGTPICLKSENVEFTNSLQVIGAERFVFSKDRNHLDLPLDMLRTDPDLRNGSGNRQRPDEV